MAYSGKYTVKNPNKYMGDPKGVVYRSLWEKHAFKWCDNSSDIIQWGSEEVVVPYYYEADRRYHRYYIDLIIELKNGKVILVEIKPSKETKPPTGNKRTKRYINEAYTYVKNQNKWEAAVEFAESKGWEFQIWTEKELSKIGILPKSTKPLKPFQKRKK